MSTIEHEIPYDGLGVSCGDGAQAIPFVEYLSKEYGKRKTDLLTMPGGSRAFSCYEEPGHKLSRKNRKRLKKMRKAVYISLATYLNHGGDEIHLCDHFGCGFWFDYPDYYEAFAAQTCSMWMTARLIQNFIKKLKEDRQFAEKYVVNPENIKVKKIVLHYATLDKNNGNLVDIKQVGELALAA